MINTGHKATAKCNKPLSFVENYDEAVKSPERWCLHHRLETHTSDGIKRIVNISAEELKALDMYWNRPPEELIYMSWKEHQSIHCNDPIVSNNHRKFGCTNGMYGRKRTLEETAKRRKQLYCVETGETYNSITEAIKQTGLSYFIITKSCKEGSIVNGLSFKYKEEN